MHSLVFEPLALVSFGVQLFRALPPLVSRYLLTSASLGQDDGSKSTGKGFEFALWSVKVPSSLLP